MPKTPCFICYHLNEALENEAYGHPSKILQELGVSFASVRFDYKLDQWIFLQCCNLPKDLPSHIFAMDYSDN